MAPLNLRFVKRAERQISEILDYIAMDNPDAAEKVAAHIELVLENARSFPDIGRKIFPDLPYREAFAYPCRMIYRRIGETLWVVAVLRVEQLLRREMLNDH